MIKRVSRYSIKVSKRSRGILLDGGGISLSLQDIDWKISYKSNDDRKFLFENFLKPAYENSSFYFRTSAFFSSSVFDSIGDGIVDFVQNGGEMMLVTNVRFSEQDQDAINKGNKQYEETYK